jgi:hypothetical protein
MNTLDLTEENTDKREVATMSRRLTLTVLFLCSCVSACGPSQPMSRIEPVKQYTDTELKLKQAYDAQGIDYDDKMLRDDARAIDALNREFNDN